MKGALPVAAARACSPATRRTLELAEHGGGVGIRDGMMLDSALERPRNRHDLGGCTDLCELAACYAFGLARNHGFLDGNKRVSAVVTELFLALNGYEVTASDDDVVRRGWPSPRER
ncbi:MULTISPECIES: type II toxin-antitoxin system death-on-curing family toxin [Methylobacterium]|uniref:type II toxin-antitoxin system death-on-curing family toxin n=1 Tax=Methylobacterium TaxID=407 RepID=UPI0028A65D11|nr:type II toxin-antitoxin system death-on-curing family toxin [Methylobacterium sp. DB0501]